jgi:tight adherence protein C
MMTADGQLVVVALVAVGSLVALVLLLLTGSDPRLEARLRELAEGSGAKGPDPLAQLTQAALPKLGAPLLPADQEERTRLQARLIQAGLYGRRALLLFLGVKMLLILSPVLLGFTAGLLGLVPFSRGLVLGGLAGVVGLLGPSLWLDWRKARRQVSLRRALPDALDVLVICLEGGLSLPGAFRRVVSELRLAHPQLAVELTIVQREVQLGCSTGEALRRFGKRADLEEVRSLASVVLQTERFGAGLVKALRVHAGALRDKRLQRAEELAQKAAVKVLFPTILFIFPAMFLVILGPAAIQILELLRTLSR